MYVIDCSVEIYGKYATCMFVDVNTCGHVSPRAKLLIVAHRCAAKVQFH